MSLESETLFNAYVSDEFRKTAKETEDKINLKINEYLAEFRSYLDTAASEFEKKDFSEKFSSEAKQIVEAATAAQAQAKIVSELIEKLSENTEGLSSNIADLKKASEQLESDLNNIHMKAEMVGKTTGTLISTAVKQLVTGGLPVFG